MQRSYDTVWLFEFHEIDDVSRGGDKESFHEDQVEILMGETVEKIQVSTAKDQQIKFLSFA